MNTFNNVIARLVFITYQVFLINCSVSSRDVPSIVNFFFKFIAKQMCIMFNMLSYFYAPWVQNVDLLQKLAKRAMKIFGFI